MLKIFWHLFFLTQILSYSTYAQTFNIGKFSIGESKINLDLSDFNIHIKNSNVTANWVPDSVQWIRNENNLLLPRALMSIRVKNTLSDIHFEYKKMVIIPFKKADQLFESKIYVDLFTHSSISIFKGNDLLEKITIEAQAAKVVRSKQLIDYSCSPYNLNIDGIDSEYLSIGCKMNQIEVNGLSYPLLEMTLSTANLRTLNKSAPPYTLYIHNKSPIEIKLIDLDESIKTMQIKASLPQRLYRLKTAFGLGPYLYQSEFKEEKQLSKLAPSIMFYAKYDLTETASIKAFDALIYSNIKFNNSGLYFSYDLATIFDGRILLNALLGLQGLHYKFSNLNKTEFQLIYPQGFEFIYKHAFIENYNLMYGMFLSSGAHPYINAWLRYGKRGFLELNFIDWGDHTNSNKPHIRMWGLSVGIPLFNAF